MDGVVAIVGVFEPGAVVSLVRVPDERTFRAEGGVAVESRIVDDAGNIGWEGLDLGAFYIAVGYVDGRPLEMRCTATDAAQQSNDLNQAPEQPVLPSVGTQEAAQEPVRPLPPAVPEGGEPLQTGIPAGVSTSVVGAVHYWIDKHPGAELPEGFAATGLQAPAFVPADESEEPVAAKPLFDYTGDGEPDPSRWEGYAGPTEPEGTSAQDSSFSGAPAGAEPQTPAAPAGEPVQTTVQVQTGADGSGSAPVNVPEGHTVTGASVEGGSASVSETDAGATVSVGGVQPEATVPVTVTTEPAPAPVSDAGAAATEAGGGTESPAPAAPQSGGTDAAPAPDEQEAKVPGAETEATVQAPPLQPSTVTTETGSNPQPTTSEPSAAPQAPAPDGEAAAAAPATDGGATPAPEAAPAAGDGAATAAEGAAPEAAAAEGSAAPSPDTPAAPAPTDAPPAQEGA